MSATRSPLRNYYPIAVLEREPGTDRPLTVRLVTGHPAEYMRTRSDCMRAALATLAGVPYAEVPDVEFALGGGGLAYAQAIADLGAWAHGLERRLVYHETPPTDRGAWIGCIPADADGPSHGLVMCMDRLVHDPASGSPLPPGHQLIPESRITYGITLDLLEES
jgi:hypothetical protein